MLIAFWNGLNMDSEVVSEEALKELKRDFAKLYKHDRAVMLAWFDENYDDDGSKRKPAQGALNSN